MYPVLFHIGSLPIRSYGVLLITGFLIGLWRAMRLCTRRMATEPKDSVYVSAPINSSTLASWACFWELSERDSYLSF